MKSERNEARSVILALRVFVNDIQVIKDAISENDAISKEKVKTLQDQLKDLKKRLRLACDIGTVDFIKRPLTQVETDSFQSAMCQAIAGCHIKANSHPIQSNWVSNLNDMKVVIDHHLSELESMYPDS